VLHSGPAHFINVLDDDSESSLLPRHLDKIDDGGGRSFKTKSNKVAWSFLNDGRRSVNGPTALKHRLLCHLGWCIVHCPFWEWQGLRGDVDAEEEYVKELLEEVIG